MKCSGCFVEVDVDVHSDFLIEETTCSICNQADLCNECIAEHEENGCGEVTEDPPIRASDVLSHDEMTGMKSIW